MAAPRPYWKGFLKLSLVSCPIAVYSASSSTERVAFRQINKKTGNRLRQQLVDEETGEVVESADKGRGYEVAKHTYMPVDEADFEGITIESSQTIEIDSFVPRTQIDERYLDSPYYLAPDSKVGQDAFAVIREAMRGKDLVALGRVVIAKRERVIMLQAWEDGLLGTTLRYTYEIRDPAHYFGEIPKLEIPDDMRTLAEHILDSKTTDFDPATFRDHYEEAVVAMLKKKQEGAPIPHSRPPAAGNNVVDLMEALRRSLGTTPKPSETLKPKANTKKRAAGQREMLLPISGKGEPKAPAKAASPAAKAPAKSTTGRKAS